MSQGTNILLEVGTNEVEIVVFYVTEDAGPGREPYHWRLGVNVAKVLEIIRLPETTEMLSHPDSAVLGAFNQRDRVIPLVDLGLLLGIERVVSEHDKVVVTEFNKIVTAFRVSGVDRIHRLSWGDIEPPSKQLSAFSSETVIGVVKLDGNVVFLVDLERIVAELNPDSAMTLEGASACAVEEPYRALVVDDSPMVRHMIRDLLKEACFDVSTAINGQMAWEMLSGMKSRAGEQGVGVDDYVDVVITDIEMPRMDGHTLTKKIKEDQTLGNLPVILFSSLITEGLRHKGESVGADLQISKPDLKTVAENAKVLIEKARQETDT